MTTTDDDIKGRMAGLEFDDDVPPTNPEVTGLSAFFTWAMQVVLPKTAVAEEFDPTPFDVLRQDIARRATMVSPHGGAAVAVTSAPRVESTYVAVEKATESTGSVTYWSTREAKRSDVITAWLQAGLPESEIIAQTTPEVALRRAVKSLQDRNILVRKNPTGGWAVVRESTIDGKLVYNVDLTVNLVGSELVYETSVGAVDTDPLKYLIDYEFAANLGTLTSDDMSMWVTRRVKAMDAVALRPMGGVYFIPPTNTAKLSQMRAALKNVGFVIYEIPAVKSAGAIEAILAAMSREAETMLVEIDSEIAGEIGPVAARNRRDEVNALADKLRRYEALLGKNTFAKLLTRIEEMVKVLSKATSRTAQLEIE